MKSFLFVRIVSAAVLCALTFVPVTAQTAPATRRIMATGAKTKSAKTAPVKSAPAKTGSSKSGAASATKKSSSAFAALRLEFDKQNSKRNAAKAGTQGRADAAQAAAKAATQIAWAAFDAQKWDEAAIWFARRAALRREAYDNQTQVLEARYAQTEREIAAGREPIALAYATLQEKYPDLHRELLNKLEGAGIVPQPVDFTSSMAAQQVVEGIVKPIKEQFDRAAAKLSDQTRGDLLLKQILTLRAVSFALAKVNAARSQRGTFQSMLQIAARSNGQYSDLLRINERDLALRRQELADFRAAKLPDERIDAQVAAVANALEGVAGAREDMGLYDQAIAAYNQSLEMRRALPESSPDRALGQPLFSLGRLHHRLGNLASARDFYQQAVELRERDAPLREQKFGAIADKDTQALTRASDTIYQIALINNYGTVISDLGDIKKAFATLEQAHQLAQGLPTSGEIAPYRTAMLATTMGNIATHQFDNGESDKALATYNRVIAMRREIGDDERAAVALMNAASLLWSKNQNGQARRYTEQARQLYAVAQDLRGVAATMNFLATLAREGNDLKSAEKYSQEALTIARKTGDNGWIASARRNLALTRHEQKRSVEALAMLVEVEAMNRRSGAPIDIKNTLELQGRILEETGQRPAAFVKYKEAIDLLESVRATARDESTFNGAEGNYRVYKRMVQLLIKLKRPDEAFDYLARAKSKEMQDSLRLDSIKTGDQALQALLKKGGELQNRLRTVQETLQVEEARPAAERDADRIQNLKLVSTQTQAEFFKVARQIREANPNFDKITAVKPTALKAAQRSIPADVALVQYVPMDEQLYIFLVTKDDLKIITPPVKTVDLWAKVKQLRLQLDEAQDGFEAGHNIAIKNWNSREAAPLRDSLTGLYNMLLAPVEADLADKKIVAFIPTQQLFYVPMHALAKKQGDGLRFLIEDKQVVYLASSDVMKVVQPQDEKELGTGLFAIGDPEGADLPAALVEVQNIAKSFPNAEVISGVQATKTAVLREGNLDKRIWHFATHGFLNPAVPDRSYIQLAPGAGGRPEEAQLSFSEVYALDLKRIDLVTLSACQTALGERNPDGSDISGLAQSFSEYAGARSVMASLWSVADDSTGELMSDFYQQLAAGKPKAQALQDAQRALMKNPKTNHPFFWAPFVLMGDWR